MSVLQMSISASILILAIIVIRAIAIHKLPKKTFVALWGVILFRLMIPLSISLPSSVYTAIDKATEFFVKTPGTQTTVPNVPNIFSPAPRESIDSIHSLINPTALENTAQLSPVIVIWVVGMMLMSPHSVMKLTWYVVIELTDNLS